MRRTSLKTHTYKHSIDCCERSEQWIGFSDIHSSAAFNVSERLDQGFLRYGDLLDLHLLEEAHGEESLNEKSPDQREGTDAHAVEVQLVADGDGTHWGATKLHHEVLNRHCWEEDEQEERVVEETSKNIVLFDSELSGVDLVEDLHAHEGLENNRVVSQLSNIGEAKIRIKLTSRVFWVIACGVAGSAVIEALEVRVVVETENFLSKEEQSDKDYDLVDCLANDVAIHHGVKNGFVDRVGLVLKEWFIGGFSGES